MINIEERISNKIPGGTSLFVSFQYNQNIIDIIKGCDTANYNKKTHEWEVPCVNLSYLLDNFCNVDNITLNVLPDENIKEVEIPKLKKFVTKPFEYQLQGIEFGLSHDKFLLLDAPGLGKTLQLLYIAEQLHLTEGLEHCLIICGVNTLKTNWKKEIEKHTKLSCRILGQRIQKRTGKLVFGGVKERIEDLSNPIDEFYIITNVESIRSDEITKLINKGPNKIDMIVFDEIHTAKSHQSAQGSNLLKLINAKHRIGATGTPIVNSPLDSYVPLKWIGVENSTFTNYKYFYCNYGGAFGNELIGYKNTRVLKSLFDKYSLRRTKDLLELPPKNIIHEYVDMNDTQRVFYDNIVEGIVDQVDKVDMKTSSLFSMIARLRQATACPTALTTENIESSKINRTCELVDEMVQNGDKIIIFSVFKETLNVLMNRLGQYKPLLCTGDVPDSIVSENIDKFQNDDQYKVILCTTAKMGVGITLTAATDAIFIDSTWTRAGNLQCEDRLHRVGSTKPVFIYYLWATDTIDEHVKEIVDDKSLVGDYIVDDLVPQHLADRLKQIISDLKK